MFEKKPADTYHKAIQRLKKAEDAHRAHLNALEAAHQARNPSVITKARKAAEAGERDLAEALQAAADAHRAYWRERRAALVPELQRMAHVIRRFNRIAVCAGDPSNNPARTLLETVSPILDDDITDDAGVPIEPPDSALLDDERGVWRP